MKKLLLCLCLLLVICPLAQAQSALVTDEADLLTHREEARLREELEEVLEQTDVALVVVTVNSLDGLPIDSYADSWFDSGSYGDDGILLLVDMDSRQWYISTAGYGMDVVTDYEAEQIGDDMAYYLRKGDYPEAFQTFVEACREEIEEGVDEVTFSNILGFGLLVGFGISLIVVLCLKRQLKSVRFKPDAHSYIRSGSMQVTLSRDIYLYSHTSRTAKPKSSSSGSSGGRSHGGAGGRF